MTAKEKAHKLWRKYAEYRKIIIEGKHATYRGLTTENAKICALITVDEIIFEIKNGIKKEWLELRVGGEEYLKYWEDVKQELDKI